MQHDKKKAKTILSVSLINAGVNTLLACIKIIIGTIGYSQALIADGIHSFSDLVSDALVFIAARATFESVLAKDALLFVSIHLDISVIVSQKSGLTTVKNSDRMDGI